MQKSHKSARWEDEVKEVHSDLPRSWHQQVRLQYDLSEYYPTHGKDLIIRMVGTEGIA